MKTISRYAIVLTALFGVAACESFVDDLNVDPNNSSDAPAELILTRAQVEDMKQHGSRVTHIAGMWSGYLTGVGRQYLSYHNYVYSAEETGYFWNTTYSGVFVQLGIAIEKFRALDNRLGVGIAKVIQAHAIGTATALFGDVPFSQAAEPFKYEHPVFDSQGNVYNSLQALLDEAIDELSSGIGSLPDGIDIYFNGNRTKWIEVAHTLKARFYMETKQYDKAYEEAQDGISAPANSMLGKSSTVSGMRNSFYMHQVQDRAGDVNAKGALLTRVLDPLGDKYRGNSKTDETARFNYYFVNLGQSGLTGDIEPNFLSSGRGDSFNGIVGMEASFPLVTYQENLLTLAEAGVRAFDLSTGLTHLNEFRSWMNNGGYIDASYTNAYPSEYDAYVEADFGSGGIENPLDVPAEQAFLQEVLEERWVTFFTQIIGFNDVRRTRKEAAGVKLTPATGDKLPERFFYSLEEINSNPNVPAPLPGLFEPTPVNKN